MLPAPILQRPGQHQSEDAEERENEKAIMRELAAIHARLDELEKREKGEG
jgi:hypothetical protein